MANERQEEMSARDLRRARIRQSAQELNNEYDQAEQERRIQEQRESFNQRRMKLEQKTLARVEKFGEQDVTAQMLMSLLEVTIQMDETIEVITSIGEAVATISDALKCVDETMQFIQDSLSISQQKKYGFFARRKAKKNIQKTISNNIGRMKTMNMMLSGSMDIADMLNDSMQDMTMNQHKMMAKRAKKQQAREKKMQKRGNAPMVTNSKAKARLDELRAANGGSAGGSGAAPGGAAPSGGTTTVSGGGSTDDYSDIL